MVRFEKTFIAFVSDDASPIVKLEGYGLSQESIDEIVTVMDKCNKRDALGIVSCKTETIDEGSFI